VTEQHRSDRFVRLIALERFLRGIALIVGGVYLLFHTGSNFGSIAKHIVSRFDLDPNQPFFRHTIDRLGRLKHHSVTLLGIAALAYGALELVEGVGLFLRQRWAEWLTVIATALFVPIEIYEVARKPSIFKAAGLAVNVVVVLYLFRVVRKKGRDS
jgi:uncharacterized membrane protein (DUF2068 family)